MSSIINTSSSLFAPEVPGAIDLSLSLGGEMGGLAESPTSFNGRLILGGDLMGRVRLALSQPAPVLNELAPFNKFSIPRLLVNGAPTGILSFNVDAPKGEIGKRLSVALTKQDLSLAAIDKTYTFQIGKKVSPLAAPDWKTLIDTAALDSRQVGIRFRGDSLSLTAIAPAEDVLKRCAAENLTIYDPDKTDISTAQVEKLYDENGVLMPFSAKPRRGLTLYWLLGWVAKHTGLAGFTTSVPDYELTRADFSWTQTFRDSLSPFFGAYDTSWFASGGILQILDRNAVLPGDFTPFAVTVDKFLSWSAEMPSLPVRDGFIVSFNAGDLEADSYIDTTEITGTAESGTFGTSEFTRIITEQTTRKWFNSAAPDVILRTELIGEKRTSWAPIPPFTITLSVVGSETAIHSFDRTGKRILTVRTVEGRFPDVTTGAIFLTQVADETQEPAYVVDPQNARRFIQNQLVTTKRGLIAIDADNPYYNPTTGVLGPFKQALDLANGAGNLREGMTTEYGLIAKRVETLTFLGNNQYQSNITNFDILRGTVGPGSSEPRAGDPSIGGTSGRTMRTVVWRDGFVPATGGTSFGLEPFSVGELPLVFALPLAKRKLAARIAKKQTGSIEIGGFSETVERGTFLTVKDRSGASLGIFIIEGYSITGENQGGGRWLLTTKLDVSEI